MTDWIVMNTKYPSWVVYTGAGNYKNAAVPSKQSRYSLQKMFVWRTIVMILIVQRVDLRCHCYS